MVTSSSPCLGMEQDLALRASDFPALCFSCPLPMFWTSLLCGCLLREKDELTGETPKEHMKLKNTSDLSLGI